MVEIAVVVTAVENKKKYKLENNMKKITLLLISIVFISAVFAQPRKGGNRNRRPQSVRMTPKHRAQLPMDGIRKGEHSGKMEMMMAMKLTEELNLTPEQGEKFFPRMKAHRDKMDKIDVKMRSMAKEMRGRLKDDNILSDKEFNSFFDEVTKIENKKVEERTRFLTELDGTLDNNQRLKLAMFKHKFADDMQVQLREKRKEFAKERKRMKKYQKEVDEYKNKLNEEKE